MSLDGAHPKVPQDGEVHSAALLCTGHCLPGHTAIGPPHQRLGRSHDLNTPSLPHSLAYLQPEKYSTGVQTSERSPSLIHTHTHISSMYIYLTSLANTQTDLLNFQFHHGDLKSTAHLHICFHWQEVSAWIYVSIQPVSGKSGA